jgi:hypothetical protein
MIASGLGLNLPGDASPENFYTSEPVVFLLFITCRVLTVTRSRFILLCNRSRPADFFLSIFRMNRRTGYDLHLPH